jgi:2-hydroxy-6-oxonona-2,4-dienedioate hydrolase
MPHPNVSETSRAQTIANRHPQADLTHRRDQVAGWSIFSRICEQAGADRDPIVLVHGLSMSSLYMAPTARRLAVDYRVYAPDFPGYGRSQWPRANLQKALNLTELAGVLHAWMNYMNIDQPAVLVGNSMGCQTIVEFALRYPERVARIVLVGPTIDPAGRSYIAQFMRGVWHMWYEPLFFWPVLSRDYLIHGLRRTLQTLGYGLADPIEEKLAQVRVPGLVVRGSNDKIVSQRWAEDVAARLPDGRLVVIPGAGHVVNYDAPDRLVEAIWDFIE